MAKAVVVIPARYASERLPGKTLLRETGKFLVQHTYERAAMASRIDEVVIATDDQRVIDAVESFGGRAVMTSPDHRSGTDRVAEAARSIDADLIINVQGDEPEIEPAAIDMVADLLERHPGADMSTLASPIVGPERVLDPHLVKVVLDSAGYALYFSRCPIPGSKSFPGLPEGDDHVYLGHLGIYGFRRDFLFRFSSLAPTPLEKHEGLEQLRALEHGHKIVVGISRHRALGIDTPDDYAAFLARWREAQIP